MATHSLHPHGLARKQEKQGKQEKLKGKIGKMLHKRLVHTANIGKTVSDRPSQDHVVDISAPGPQPS